MKQNRIIITALLCLLLGIPAFANAKEESKEKGGGEKKAQQSQHRGSEKGKPVADNHGNNGNHGQGNNGNHGQVNNGNHGQGNNGNHGQGNNGNHYGRIPDNHFHAYFGRGHAFRMESPRFVNGYNRFRYNGYLFGYKERWPSGWNYNDNVYVDYVGGAYYMYNPRHPGVHITLNLF
jgi:hypothetical protein